MQRSNDKGFIGLIILIIIALVLLKYFLNWSVFQAAATPQGQETVSYTHQIFNTIWSHVATPLTFVWERIFHPILSLAWSNFENFLSWGKMNASKPH